jgi:hypothetical protein
VETVIFPFCNQTLSTSTLERLLKQESETPALQQMFEETFNFVKQVESTWIAMFREIVPSKSNMIADMLVSPILSSIQSGIPIIFSPTIPDSFQHVTLTYVIHFLTA